MNMPGVQFYQESYKRFVTAMSQDSVNDFNCDFTGVFK